MTQLPDIIVSFIDGRVRVRHPAMKRPEVMKIVLSTIEGMEGVTALQGNPLTGSLLLFYDAEHVDREKILNHIVQYAYYLEQSSASKLEKRSDRYSLKKKLLGRSATKMVNRVLLASMMCTLGGIAAGNARFHKIAGMLFCLACLQHIAVHRKFL